ncbi:MAG: hypothetical protein D6705_02025 [Deltaproteobacteria bacterium]|nr:MAG: hypothetical protein D6705_02025 [Deltaproteobacteria bacterium]
MDRRVHRRIFWSAVGALVAAHAAAPSSAGSFAGIPWLPFDLGYHLAWTGAAAGVVVHLCTCVWEDAP